MFAGFAILGPLLIFFHANILLFDRNSFNCGRVIELRTIILQSMQHVWVNLFCRFFYIVHAEKGLLVRHENILLRENKIGVSSKICRVLVSQVHIAILKNAFFINQCKVI